MAQVIIRNLEQGVVDIFKWRAERQGRSLEQELRSALTEAAKLSAEEKLALIDQFRAMGPREQKSDSTDLLREDRDR